MSASKTACETEQQIMKLKKNYNNAHKWENNLPNRKKKDKRHEQKINRPPQEYKRPIKIWGQKLQPQMRYAFHIKLGEKFKLANEKRYILTFLC